MKPTTQTYNELQIAYDRFNDELFDGQLPHCLITLQREKKTYGYFSAQRFANHAGDKTDEIALNPTYFAVVPLIEIMQTLVHEMVHLWQHHFGKPGRGRYHNDEWAKKMESIGLMPSDTGQPGGKRTGDQIADYPIEDGNFLKVCRLMLTEDFRISWYDRIASDYHVQVGQNSFGLTMTLPIAGSSIPALNGIEMAPTPIINKSNRSKYTCSCKNSVWGKPGLKILCGECTMQYVEAI
jgi:predicted SprT family Zn-dependent metalloprotease